MLVRCQRDNTTWEATPEPYPSRLHPMSEKRALESHLDWPVEVINCPTCCRGYFRENGIWMSDRPLKILST